MGSDSAPVRDAITHGLNGLLIDPYDIETMVDQMLAVLDAPERYQPLREAARQSMVENFSFYVCLPKLAEFYLGNPASCNVQHSTGALISA
jgi:glycosyltransferase involved in cell wall biosynthesis